MRLIFGILCACVLVLTNQEVNLDVMRSTSIIYILGYFFLYTSSSVVTGDTIQCSRCLKISLVLLYIFTWVKGGGYHWLLEWLNWLKGCHSGGINGSFSWHIALGRKKYLYCLFSVLWWLGNKWYNLYNALVRVLNYYHPFHVKTIKTWDFFALWNNLLELVFLFSKLWKSTNRKNRFNVGRQLHFENPKTWFFAFF